MVIKMQIKINGKSVLIGNIKYYNVYLIDIDDNRIELNDVNHMVIGVADIKDFTISDTDAQQIKEVQENISFQNGATIITDNGDFYDIVKINKNAIAFELIGKNGIDGRIYHYGNDINIDIAEYNENGHLTGEVYSLE